MSEEKEKKDIRDSYMDRLKERESNKRVTTSHQMTGLSLANILDDQEHKGLYMRLAKKYDGDALMRLAKDVAERDNVRNRGAYFMKLFQKKKDNIPTKNKNK